ncbi:unnamed protein product [Ostreobium quekettii]|uniref:NADH-cytochrome b5 reductase n=1 Tax=Ostreobium quekettii TaxID=121088 RepID=A0A8S1IRV6_9CHLO|nr:unnamed protein product [Ostreobium quekettii]|eukprot:evm.model.scf_151.10 EVM.evm.TU.scf_151.10   scf_151:75816-76973(+)
METPQMDARLVTFLNDNLVALVVAFVAIAAIQVYWFATRPPRPFLMPDLYQPLTLSMKRNVTHNTLFLRFKLPEANQTLGLTIGRHVAFTFTDPKTDKPVYRPYTPVTDADTKGHVDFVIKVYKGGQMSQHLDKLEVGDRVEMKGPKGRFTYKRNMKKSIGMLAGGTGITPMYQVLNHILNDPKDTTHVSLIYANISVEDILLKKNLEQLVSKYPTRFDVYYTLDNPPSGWNQGKGYISGDMIKNNCPPPGDDVLMLYCGPSPMTAAMTTLLDDLGYSKDMRFQF